MFSSFFKTAWIVALVSGGPQLSEDKDTRTVFSNYGKKAFIEYSIQDAKTGEEFKLLLRQSYDTKEDLLGPIKGLGENLWSLSGNIVKDEGENESFLVNEFSGIDSLRKKIVQEIRFNSLRSGFEDLKIDVNGVRKNLLKYDKPNEKIWENIVEIKAFVNGKSLPIIFKEHASDL